MTEQRVEGILNGFITLFLRAGEQQLCTISEFKHYVEYFADLFIGQHAYIPSDVAKKVLIGTGFTIEDNNILAMWHHPDFDELANVLDRSDFDNRVVGHKQIIPFYRIPERRVRAMLDARSSAWDMSGKYFWAFPMFNCFEYEHLSWIEEEGGVLAFKINYDCIMLDTICVDEKRKGSGERLLRGFFDSITDLRYDDTIVIDAYTKESKAFFSSMAKRYNILRPSDRFSKPDVYEVRVADLMSDIKKDKWMDRAIKELFSKGIVKGCEDKGLYDSIIANKEQIEAYFLMINRAVLISTNDETVHLCAPVLEMNPNYDPYENFMPTPEEFARELKQHADEDPEFAKMLRSISARRE